MNPVRIVSTLDAWVAGRALPFGETLAWPRADRDSVLIVTFVRMGGEVLPWGVAYGKPGAEPRVMAAPDPRDVDRVAETLAAFAPVLLAHAGHPSFEAGGDHWRRQLWTAGASHVDMLHLLEYRFLRAKHGDPGRLATLKALARAAGWLFRESQRPGQVRVFDASARLREAFSFPADAISQQHLGFLMAWLDGGGGDAPERMLRAIEAGSVSVGTTLDPELENDTLDRLVERYVGARKGDGAKAAAAAQGIERVLRDELLRRWKLTEAAWALLDGDPRPSLPNVDALLRLAADEWAGQYKRVEDRLACAADEADVFVPHPETDHGAPGAAARFFANVGASEIEANVALHGDRARLAEAVSAGDAFAGTVIEVREERVGRSRFPYWVVEGPLVDPSRLREGSKVAVAGTPNRYGKVRSVEVVGDRRRVTFAVENGKTGAGDPSIRGARVTLVGTSMATFSRMKSMAVWKAEGPGAWLTHGAPRPASSEPARRQEDLLSIVKTLGA